MKKDELFGHPKGLCILFFTEMWERFSFYGIRAILVLYMIDTVANGGFGWSKGDALMVLGFFQLFVYLTAIPGGMIADRWLGQRKSVWIGCLLIMLGNFTLVVPSSVMFFAALILIACGGGFLKPNISTLVSRLYPSGDPRREAAFTIFYMSINIGAFFSPLVVGSIGEKCGWHWGFLASGIGMLLGQGVYAWGQRRYLSVADAAENAVSAAAAAVAKETEHVALTPAEKRRIWVILLSFVSVIVFWAAYEQCGGLLNLYTKESTNRMLGSFEVPTTWFQALNPMYIVIFAPVAAALWTFLGRRKKDPSAITKMGIGTVILGLGYLFMVAAVLQRDSSPDHLSSMSWVALVYLSSTIGELALSPVALSFITSTAPQRMTSRMLGWFFAVTGVAGWLAAKIGTFAEGCGELKVFTSIAIGATAVGLIQLAFSRKINQLATSRD